MTEIGKISSREKVLLERKDDLTGLVFGLNANVTTMESVHLNKGKLIQKEVAKTDRGLAKETEVRNLAFGVIHLEFLE